MAKLIGIDISNNNGHVDLESVKRAGVSCVYLKATEGKTFKDSYMDEFYNQCKNLGLKVGAYHFLVSSSSPEDQMENFVEMIKGYEWDMIPMLDVETNFNGLCSFVTRAKKRFEQLSDLELGIYSYTSFIPLLKSISQQIADMKFWEANYNNNPWNLSDTYFNNRIGHQYSDKGVFGNFKGDVNQFTEDILIDDKGDWLKGKEPNQNKWWYKHDDGSYTFNGWEKIRGKWYYFDEEGWMKTGWIYDGNEYYYCCFDGTMVTGWLKQDGNWYYLKENGQMAHDEILTIHSEEFGDERYVFNSSGHMETTNDRGALI